MSVIVSLLAMCLSNMAFDQCALLAAFPFAAGGQYSLTPTHTQTLQNWPLPTHHSIFDSLESPNSYIHHITAQLESE